jgi:hypothetical protein
MVWSSALVILGMFDGQRMESRLLLSLTHRSLDSGYLRDGVPTLRRVRASHRDGSNRSHVLPIFSRARKRVSDARPTSHSRHSGRATSTITLEPASRRDRL